MCTCVDNRGIRCTAFYLPYKDLIGGGLSSAFMCMNSLHGFSIWRTGRYNLTKFADFQRTVWLPWMMTCILCIIPICYLMLACSMLLPYGLLWGAAKVSACPSAENLDKQVSLSRIFRETQQNPAASIHWRLMRPIAAYSRGHDSFCRLKCRTWSSPKRPGKTSKENDEYVLI